MRLYDSLPSIAVYGVDDRAFVGFLLHGQLAVGSPQIELMGRDSILALSVGVTNTRYAETVEVALMRSVAGGGFDQVGQVTQSVPVRAGGRTTTFSISYTFAPEDAELRKVTFQAVATIRGARDANAADNTVIALPTKVAS